MKYKNYNSWHHSESGKGANKSIQEFIQNMKRGEKKGYNCGFCISLDKFFHLSVLNTEKYCEKNTV